MDCEVLQKPFISQLLYFAVFPKNVSSLEFNFADFKLLRTLLQCTAKTFSWYLISQKQFMGEIREINPMQNLRLLQYLIFQVENAHWIYTSYISTQGPKNISHNSL